MAYTQNSQRPEADFADTLNRPKLGWDFTPILKIFLDLARKERRFTPAEPLYYLMEHCFSLQ